MKLRLSICSLILVLFFISCNFNNRFLHPTSLPSNLEVLQIKSDKDTIFLKFEGLRHQPFFIGKSNDTLHLGYTIESVVINSKSGNELNGWIIKPESPNHIVLVHYPGNAGFIVSNSNQMLPFVKRGFTVITVDYSGFGFSTGKATKENVLLDAFSTLDYVKTREDVNGMNFVLYGQSLGGHLAVVVASKKNDDIDGLVIEGAFSSHKDIAAEQAGILGRILVKEEYSAEKSIQDYNKPILVIHSVEDETIPIEHGKTLFDIANQPKEFYEINGEHISGPQLYGDSIGFKITEMLVD